MAEKIRVSNEGQVWGLLHQWVEDENMPEVEFDGWPVLSIVVEGTSYSSSLNSNQMAALVAFKMTLGRAYAMLAHGAYDMRRLHVAEEEQIDFNTEVKKGSSILETDLTPLIKALAAVATSYPGSTLVVGLLLGLAFVARPVILKHYEARAQQLEANERDKLLNLALSNNEQNQYLLYEKALEKAAKVHPQIRQALPDARHAFWKLATASANADRMNVSGLELTGANLEVLSERRATGETQTEEVSRSFRVAGLSKKSGRESYRIKLEGSGLVITATYHRPYMTDARVTQLMGCITNSRTITATLEVKTAGRAQLSARLVRFTVDPVDDAHLTESV